jgi:hypothetical protein
MKASFGTIEFQRDTEEKVMMSMLMLLEKVTDNMKAW